MADNAFNRPRNALMDTAQGVSKGFWADGLGGPVDLMTTLANLGIAGGGYAGHKLGLLSQPPELISNPTGGSEWIAQQMRQRGLLNDNPGSTADNYGRVAGGLLAPLTQARAPQIANALNQAPAALQRGAYAVGEKAAGMAENHLVRQGAIQPATVWHGTPHKFDKFDASKIGTGEGAQAYGHGLYLAESKDVASSYQDKLTDPAFKYAGMNEAKARLNEKIAARVEATDPARAAALRSEVASLGEAGGHLYKIDLPDEHIAKMLDWDKSMADHPLEVRNAWAKAYRAKFGRVPEFAPSAINGAQAVDMIAGGATGMQQFVKESADASARLSKQGIPGIRYLDGGSRGAGQGSSNFVVFPGNEGLLSILERNGQPLK